MKRVRPAAEGPTRAVAGAAGAAVDRARKEFVPAARQSGSLMKHVVPAVVKPLHTLWHEILGFVFLAFAGIGAFKIWRRPEPMPPMQLAIVLIFVFVTAGYGIASVRKARRISRS